MYREKSKPKMKYFYISGNNPTTLGKTTFIRSKTKFLNFSLLKFWRSPKKGCLDLDLFGDPDRLNYSVKDIHR